MSRDVVAGTVGTVRLALAGFGAVGRDLMVLLAEQEVALARQHGLRFVLTAVGTGAHGSLLAPDGLAPGEVARRWPFPEPERSPAELAEAAATGGADVLVLATPARPDRGDAAVSAVQTAFEHGLDVVTVDKSPVAWGYRRLSATAARHGRRWRFEGVAMDGCPVFSVVERCLPLVAVTALRGVLSSTSNVVLDAVASGGTVEQAVAEAQAGGFAEADPTLDLSGYDAAAKVACLANVLLGADLTPDQVRHEGVEAATPARLAAARSAGQRLRLVSTARRPDGPGMPVAAEVRLEAVDPDDPAFAVSGSSSMVALDTDLAGTVEIVERRPTLRQTSYAVLSDLVLLSSAAAEASAEGAS